MTGRAAVLSDQQRLDAIFARARTLQHDPELLSDFARYLCILVSGYLEKSLAELVFRTRSESSGAKSAAVPGEQYEAIHERECRKDCAVTRYFRPKLEILNRILSDRVIQS